MPLAASRSNPPASSSLDEERTHRLPPPPLSGARFSMLAACDWLPVAGPVGLAGDHRAGRTQAAAPGSPQRERADREETVLDQDHRPDGAGVPGAAAAGRSEELHTVCQEAGCPNIFECWEDREATFLIGGDQCTRRCDFCQIDTGKPADLDAGEPLRVAESVQKMQLRYATVTGVCRDDLPDEGAWLYAETIRQIHRLNPDTGVEMLAPDFSGNLDLSASSSPRPRRCSRTTSRRCRGSSGGSARASATSARSTCCGPRAAPGW